MNSKQTSEKQIAIDAILKSIPLCQQVEADMVAEDTVEKEDGSPVTVADFATQALICQALGEAFPEDPIVAEEDSQELRENPQLMQRVTGYVNSFTKGALSAQAVCDLIDRGRADVGGRFWTLDPIDGTKEFPCGGPYSIALALIVDGKVKLGRARVPKSATEMGCPTSTAGMSFRCRARERGVDAFAGGEVS